MNEEENKNPEVDESLLTKEQKEAMEQDRKIPWKYILYLGILLTLIIACVIVILALPK